jgi:hypothetical protein
MALVNRAGLAKPTLISRFIIYRGDQRAGLVS